MLSFADGRNQVVFERIGSRPSSARHRSHASPPAAASRIRRLRALSVSTIHTDDGNEQEQKQDEETVSEQSELEIDQFAPIIVVSTCYEANDLIMAN